MHAKIHWLQPNEFLENSEWWHIYENAFPLNERDSQSQLLYALMSKIANIGTYYIDDRVAGIAVIYTMKKLPFMFLHYFAIAESFRNGGFGSQMFSQIMHEFEDKALIWEVEDIHAARNADEKKLRERRINFYLRHGATLLNNPFIQPPLHHGECIPMRLMQYSSQPQRILEDEKLIAEAIYFEKYQVVNRIDASVLFDLLDRCDPVVKQVA